MTNVLIVFFVLSLIVLLFVFPFKSRLMGHFDLLGKKGFYSFKIWRVKILCGKVCVDENNKMKIENLKNTIKSKYKEEFSKFFWIQMLKSVDVKKIEIFFTGGIKKDSFSSAMLCSGARLIVDVLYSYISQNYEDARLYEDISPEFNDDQLEMTFDFVLSINIYQILKSLIKAKLILKKESAV